MLQATGLTKRFGEVAALDGVDLTLTPGQTVAVIGPSGCGKSTLLRALSLVEPPDAGKLEVGGSSWEFPLSLEDDSVLSYPWPEVLVVFQSLFLWPHLSLRENIELPLRNASNANPEWTQRLVHTLGLESLLERMPFEASLGQRQRVALVRALALQPKYLLLDEVTSALDLESTRRVIDVLRQARTRGMGLLLVTHQLRVALELADAVVLFDRGRIVEQGSPSILTNPQTERLKEFLLLDTAAGS